MIDPATGGWGLPLIGGSGTNILVSDGDAEGRLSLIVGESQIAGFTFPMPDSQMADTGDARLDLTFDIWIYEQPRELMMSHHRGVSSARAYALLKLVVGPEELVSAARSSGRPGISQEWLPSETL